MTKAQLKSVHALTEQMRTQGVQQFSYDPKTGALSVAFMPKAIEIPGAQTSAPNTRNVGAEGRLDPDDPVIGMMPSRDDG